MKLNSQQLIAELSTIVDSSLARNVVESYGEMEQRFLIGDWQPAELDGGRLCEAISRCLYQLDTGRITQSKSVREVREQLLNNSVGHKLRNKDRYHLAKVIEIVYKFRSDRGAVHISSEYTANYMDSMLVLHAGKWVLAEFLRLAWNSDEKVIAETIERLVQLEHSVIHELDGKPYVLAKGISAPHEVLLLLNHASNKRLSKAELQGQAPNQSASNVSTAVNRLLVNRDIRVVDGGFAITPNGQTKVLREIMPKLKARK